MTINIGQLATVALRNRSGELKDNILNHNATFYVLNMKGNVKNADGGRDIVEELEYAENSTVAWYSGSEVLDTSAQQTFDAATFDWKQLAGTVTMDGLEEIKNGGKNRIIPLLESKIKNLGKSLRNTAATAVYSDGTGTSGKELGGLQLLVADDPTASSVVGGINQATYAFWRNQYSAAAATTSANITNRMNNMWLSCIRGTDKPDLITADSIMYVHYLDSLQALQRYTDDKMAAAGFTTVKYQSANVVYDDQCVASHMYFLNTDYLYLRPHTTRQFRALDKRNSTNQDAEVIPVVWAGNMTCSNRDLQGVIIAS